MTTQYEILLIEDDPVDRRFMASALLGAESSLIIETADDGSDALDRLDDNKLPDLILFDLKMPRMDGFTFLERVKSDPRFKQVPAVVVSTSRDKHDVERCLDAHANAYVSKPASASGYSETANALVDFWLRRAQRVH